MRAYAERKVPVIVRSAYTVFLERTSGLTFIHCTIHERWTSNVRNALLEDWKAFRLLHDDKICALHVPGDSKHLKFLTLFGFHYIGSFADAATGSGLDLFIHTGA